MNWSLIVAANDEAILKSCLASSPCVSRARDFQVMRGFTSAGAAFNAGMHQAASDILVFAHQDVFLPPDWDVQLGAAIAKLSVLDPEWAILGVYGISREGEYRGHVFCTGLQRVLGRVFSGPVECTALDEIVLIVRRSAGLAFDEQLPGFHFYGTDICLEAGRRKFKCYIVPAFCIHNTAGLTFLPWAFWRSYFYMRRKWWNLLPILSTCTVISKWGIPFIDHPLRSAYVRYVKGEQAGGRIEDIASLYRSLMDGGRIPHTLPMDTQIT